MTPIWKDYFVDFTTLLDDQQFVDYVIKKGNEVIYNGRAYKSPEILTKIRISDIIADHLGHISLPDLLASVIAATPDFDAIGTFTTIVNDEEQDEEAFFNCWDYKTSTLPVQTNLSGTISKEYVSGMPIVRSAAFVYLGGLQINHFKGANAEYKLVECCNPAALYFYNAQCGWDFLLCKGGAKRVDTFTRATIKRDYYNAARERGTFNYQNTDKVEWDVMTGWIPNEGSKNLWQLLGSTDVWLWTPDEGLVPVVITTNSVESKDYKTNGRQPVQMTIRVELAQDRQRR